MDVSLGGDKDQVTASAGPKKTEGFIIVKVSDWAPLQGTTRKVQL